MKRMNRISKKFLPLCLAGLLAASMLVGFVQTDDSSTSQPANKDTASESQTSAKHSDISGKEETVYVVVDAYGKPTDITSSIWLKNRDGSATIEDVSALTEIENVNGDATFKQSGQDITWQANGSDIYYQGKTDKELPLSVTINYELDGEKISAEKLAGANGHLKIDFTYTNNTAEKRVVNGKEVTLYQPFTVMSGLMLDGDTAHNIKVTNGKTTATADASIVMGMAMPGLKESLGINEMRDSDGQPVALDIPEKVSIEADVEDFELITTITIVDNTMLADVDLDNIRSVEDLQAAIRELKNASAELSRGTAELYDGVDALSEGTSEFAKGAEELNRGAGELKDGADALNKGTGELKKGTEALSNGAAGLYNGALSLNGALKGNDGKSIYEGVEAIESGAKVISSGIKSKDPKNPGIYEAAGGIKEGSDAISKGAGEMSKGTAAIVGEVESVEKKVDSITEKAEDIVKRAEQIKEDLSDEMKELLDKIDALFKLGVIKEKTYAALKAKLSEYTGKIDELHKSLDAIKDGANEISAGAKSGDPENPGIYEVAEGIESGADRLSKGADELAEGAGKIKAGINEITSDENLGALIDGLKELEKGAGALDAGVGKVDEGAGSLAEGVSSFKEGTEAFSSNGKDLSNGVSKILEGAGALKEGMAAFDEEGIKKLSDISDGDLSNFLERLRALKKMGEEFDSFTGIKEGTPGKVQFIIRTESIEK